jgi:NIMA (never in mitosis gene a)-related kinase
MRSATSQFKVLKKLGKGGCGRALLAKDIKTSELMVIKEIIFSEKEDSQRTAALNEIKVIEKLKHNNIIKFYGSSSSNEKILLLMEYADGGDLESLIQNQNKKLFDENKILDIFIQLCFAVKYLHDRKILHRDLKPSNVFMTNKGTVKLGDFGFEKALASTISLNATQVRTPYCISPEILKEKQYSYSTDIWSLGAILYELTALNHPFEAEDLTELMKKIMNERTPRVPSRYSDELRNLVSKILQKNQI